MPRPAAAGLSASLLMLLVCAAGCDIFQTRDPEPPTQSTSTFEPPVTPEAVLHNLTSAVRENNVDNYLRCFVDTTFRPFDFVPSQDVRSNFSVWTLEDERRYFRSMGATIDGTPLLTSAIQNTTFYADSTYNVNYSLYFPHRDASAPKFVRGNMQLHLAIDAQGRWGIDQWRDNKLPSTADSTWSYLKFWFDK
jgi:hypothetical protein